MSVDYTPDNTFIFSFVRMNPPTPGHLELIKTMIDKAIDLGVDKAYVITSSSLDGKNPLEYDKQTIQIASLTQSQLDLDGKNPNKYLDNPPR